MIKFINILFFIFSLILYVSSPASYNYIFCLTILIFFVLQNIIYFVLTKRSLVSFEFFFMFAFAGVNLIYPVFYFPTNPTFNVFELYFNYDIISKATSIAYLGYSCYMLGLSLKFEYQDDTIEISHNILSNNFFRNTLIVFLTLSISYIASVGSDFFNGYSWYVDEQNHSPITSFMEFSAILFTMFIFRNKSKIKQYIYVFIILSFTAIYLLSGSRNIPVELLIILFVSYNINVKKISNSVFLLFIIIGLFTLSVITIIRSEGILNYLLEGQSIQVESNSNMLDFAADLIINNRNLYVLVDYADTNGITYGVTMLSGVLGLVPYLGSFVSEKFNIPLDLMFTPGFNTYLEFGHGSQYGLGGNMVADVYLSFGIFGVVIAFFAFGLFASFIISRYKYNVKAYIVYFILAGTSVYINRESYLLPFRTIVYTLIMFWLLNTLSKKIGNEADENQYNNIDEPNLDK